MNKIVDCNCCSNAFDNKFTYWYPHHNNTYIFICYKCFNHIYNKFTVIENDDDNFNNDIKNIKKLSLLKINKKFSKNNLKMCE